MVRKIIWALFIMCAALWSGLAALGLQLLEWSLTHLPLAGSTDLAQQLQQWPLPEWVSLFMDPAATRQLLTAMADLLQWLMALLPSLGPWIGALVWVIWGAGLLTLLALALLGHGLSRFLQTPSHPPRA